MATGGMSWQYQNQKHLPSYGLSGGNDGAGDVQDMHLKMSKKIAQLTKVIYALNTKNDDHEANLSALKDAHEEEMQQLIAETSGKIEQYRLKIGNELDLRRKVRNLEECVHVFEREKKQALVEMEARERHQAEREVDRDRDHDRKIQEVTREMLETKAAFEQRISDFENIVRDLESEKHKNMDSLTSEYKRQVDELRAKLVEQQQAASRERESLVSSHGDAVRKFQAEVDRLQSELRKVVEESDAKIEKAKSFYEHELSVLRATSSTNDEMTAKWKESEAALKREAAKVERSLKMKIKDIEKELEIQREETNHLNLLLSQSKSEANGTMDHIKDLRDQLSKLQKDYNSSTNRNKCLEEDLKEEKTRTESQSKDLMRKTNIIGTLEAIKLTQQESIHGLEEQMRDLRKRLQDLESEKLALQNSQTDENSQLLQQLKLMSKKVDSLNEEKSALHKQFKHDLEELKFSHEEESERLKQQFEKEADSMATNHRAEIEIMKSETKEAMDKLLREMEERIRRETQSFETQKAEALEMHESEKQIIQQNLQHAQAEINRLNELASQHESGLGDASSHIASLKARIGELESDVTSAETRHRVSEAAVGQLRTELKEVNDANERKIYTLLRDHQGAIEKTKRENDEKWEIELRKQLSDMEKRMNSQHIEDRLSALQDLELRKNREMEASKSGWEDQIKQLTARLSELKQTFDGERRDFERKLESNRTDVMDIERKLRHEAEVAANEHAMKMNHLIESHEMALAALEQRKDEELKSQEARFKSQHREEMHSQMRSQQIAIEGVRDQMVRSQREEMVKKDEEFNQEMDDLRSELNHQHAMALDDVRRQYEGQIAVAKSELEELFNSKSRNDERMAQKMTDLETDLKMSAAEVNKLRDRVTEQNEMLSNLNKGMGQKEQEILRIRSEADVQLRRHDEELNRRFQSSQDRQEAEFIRQKQSMVYEFNKATDALKDKMSSLSIALYQAEEKYQNRESRPEDLDAIKQLKSLVRDREEQIQKLIDDKKFYQMELVNRETNFNKVFTASPNVGVLDPRNKKKKGSSNSSAPPRFSSQFVSVPNLNSIETAINGSNRLEPLRTGSSSPGSYNKHLQPTPPAHPKKLMRIEDQLLQGYMSDDTAYVYKDATAPRTEPMSPTHRSNYRTSANLEPLQVLLEEQYDNVTETRDSDVDFFSRDVTMTLNKMRSEWTSEGDLPTAVSSQSNGRRDLCTNEVISLAPQCGSLPDNYHLPRTRRKKRSFMSVLRVKRK